MSSMNRSSGGAGTRPTYSMPHCHRRRHPHQHPPTRTTAPPRQGTARRWRKRLSAHLARIWHEADIGVEGAERPSGANLGAELGRRRVERVTGIEPALSAWEADVLPLNYTRDGGVESSGCGGGGALR